MDITISPNDALHLVAAFSIYMCPRKRGTSLQVCKTSISSCDAQRQRCIEGFTGCCRLHLVFFVVLFCLLVLFVVVVVVVITATVVVVAIVVTVAVVVNVQCCCGCCCDCC